MKPAAFTYHRATSVAEAVSLLVALGDDARLLAGGQSLVPMMNFRVARPAHLIDVNPVRELDFIREQDGELAIGALARHHAIEVSDLVRRHCPILSAAARNIGHYAIRQRGTIGGSLALADPSAEWPLMAVLLAARVEAVGATGRRTIAAAEFFQNVFTTALQPGELITSVVVPKLAAGEGWGFRWFSRRTGDFSIAAAAATLTLNANRAVGHMRLALSGAGPTPVALSALAASQAGVRVDDAWAETVARAAAAQADPEDSPQMPAEFRRELLITLTRRALQDCIARAA